MALNFRTSKEDEQDALLVPFANALWDELLEHRAGGGSLQVFANIMRQDPKFQTLTADQQASLTTAAIVLDPNQPAEKRIAAAMSVDNVVYTGSLEEIKKSEAFLGRIFQGITVNGNIGNDADKIRAIETAINRLTVNGVNLHVDVDGKADNQLAALLRNPEVVRALKEASDSGKAAGVAFNDTFELSDHNIRTHGKTPQQRASPG